MSGKRSTPRKKAQHQSPKPSAQSRRSLMRHAVDAGDAQSSLALETRVSARLHPEISDLAPVELRQITGMRQMYPVYQLTDSPRAKKELDDEVSFVPVSSASQQESLPTSPQARPLPKRKRSSSSTLTKHGEHSLRGTYVRNPSDGTDKRVPVGIPDASEDLIEGNFDPVFPEMDLRIDEDMHIDDSSSSFADDLEKFETHDTVRKFSINSSKKSRRYSEHGKSLEPTSAIEKFKLPIPLPTKRLNFDASTKQHSAKNIQDILHGPSHNVELLLANDRKEQMGAAEMSECDEEEQVSAAFIDESLEVETHEKDAALQSFPRPSRNFLGSQMRDGEHVSSDKSSESKSRLLEETNLINPVVRGDLRDRERLSVEHVIDGDSLTPLGSPLPSSESEVEKRETEGEYLQTSAYVIESAMPSLSPILVLDDSESDGNLPESNSFALNATSDIESLHSDAATHRFASDTSASNARPWNEQTLSTEKDNEEFQMDDDSLPIADPLSKQKDQTDESSSGASALNANMQRVKFGLDELRPSRLDSPDFPTNVNPGNHPSNSRSVEVQTDESGEIIDLELNEDTLYVKRPEKPRRAPKKTVQVPFVRSVESVFGVRRVNAKVVPLEKTIRPYSVLDPPSVDACPLCGGTPNHVPPDGCCLGDSDGEDLAAGMLATLLRCDKCGQSVPNDGSCVPCGIMKVGDEAMMRRVRIWFFKRKLKVDW